MTHVPKYGGDRGTRRKRQKNSRRDCHLLENDCASGSFHFIRPRFAVCLALCSGAGDRDKGDSPTLVRSQREETTLKEQSRV